MTDTALRSTELPQGAADAVLNALPLPVIIIAANGSRQQRSTAKKRNCCSFWKAKNRSLPSKPLPANGVHGSTKSWPNSNQPRPTHYDCVFLAN